MDVDIINLHDSSRYASEFIARPTMEPIELNAHQLISFYRRLRDQGNLHLLKFLQKLNSQAYEALFRKFRSMNTFQSTSINMSQLEVNQKTKRINILTALEKKWEDDCKLTIAINNLTDIIN